MSLVELVKQTGIKLNEQKQLSNLKQTIDDNDKILKKQVEIKTKLGQVHKAGMFSRDWQTEQQHNSIVRQVQNWQQRYAELDVNRSDSVDYQSTLTPLKRIYAELKENWRQYADQELRSVRDLSIFMMKAGILSSAEQNELTTHLSELTRGVKQFPDKITVLSFRKELKGVQKKISNLDMSDELQVFIQKLQDDKATVADLTPDVEDWFRRYDGLSKLKITLG